MEFDLFHNLATGFGAALSFKNLGFALIGCLLGTLIGVLPGIGPIPTIAMLLPITFGLDPLPSLIMLAGLFLWAPTGRQRTRYTFGVSDLWDGIDFLPLVIGLFGIVEVIRNLEQKELPRPQFSAKMRDLWPSMQDFRDSWRAVLRGTLLGSLLGILPGGGAVLASFASYTLEKKVAKDPSRFGKGAIEGVDCPESA